MQVESPSTHAPANAIVVPDAHLLFGGDFKRSGVDLILSNADSELVLHDYFKGEHRAALASPDGAHLTGNIVNALTGHVEYAQAQADGSAGVAHVIGHVTKLAGTATAIRNGVSIILNQGENVEKGDVIQSGSDSTVGITFIDGTVFGLSSNARMVLNEMVYDPNGSNNSSLISLVAGTISFVAGETAKHGDMKVDTPVATMGIRGTAVLVEIDFNVPGQNGLPDAKFQVLVEPDGTTGSYILFDKTTLDPIATVNKAGQQVNINQNGISYSQSPLSSELQKLITDVFTQKFTNINDTNTKTFDHFTDSVVPLPFQSFQGPDHITVTPVVLLVNAPANTPTSNLSPNPIIQHIDQPPTVATTSSGFTELHGVTGSPAFDKASGIINFVDINAGDQPTATTTFKSFSYQNAHQQDISQSLTATEQAAVKTIEFALNVAQDPAAKNNGTANWSYTVADGSFDFLGAGETLTLTYLAHVSNNYAPNIEITTVPITITITGTNDVPVIRSVVPQTIAFDGGTSVQGGDLTAHVATSGTISFDDPDLTDTHTVSVATPTSTLTDPLSGITTAFILPPTPQAIFGQALTASIATDSTGTGLGTVHWDLADLPVWLGDFVPQGETLTLTYLVTVTDSQGAIAKQNITVTITGTDTPAVVWIATTGTGPAPDGLWGTGANWETGAAPTAGDDAIIITNQLMGLTPSYPVTIDAAATANSLQMDNFGGSAPVLINQSALAIGGAFDINDHSTDNPVGYTGPELDNQGTLTVGGAFTLSVDSIVDNSGSITVDGLMKVLDASVLDNSGTVTLANGGDFGGQSSISNTATAAMIEVSGGTLTVEVDIANLGTIQIDSTAALTLSGETITGGTVTNKGTLTLDGAAALKDGTLGNSSQIKVSGTGNALDNERVTNTGTIEVVALGALTLDLLTTVANAGHSITVDGTGMLTLQGGAEIDNGSLSNSGTIKIEGAGATLDGVTVTGSGDIEVDIVAIVPLSSITPLTLEGGTQITDGTMTVGSAGTLAVQTAAGATLDHVGVTNSNSIEVFAGSDLALDGGTTVGNSAGIVTVDGTGKLTLNGATINGGIINDFTSIPSGGTIAGDIDVTGSSTIGNAALNHGNVTLESGVTLTLDGSTVTGTSFSDIASGATIQIDGGVANTVKLSGATINGGIINDFTSIPSGGAIAGDIDVTGSSTISNAALNQGNVTIESGVTLTLTDDAVAGTNFTDNASGATIQVVGNTTLDDVVISGGTVTNTDTTLTVDSGHVLKLQDGVTVSGGTLNNSGTLDIESSSGVTLDGVNITGTGDIQVDPSSPPTVTTPLLLEGGTKITGGTLTVGAMSGALAVKSAGGAALDHVGVTNDKSIEIFAGSNLTLDDGTSIDNSFGTITVDGKATLTLNAATINGGTINDFTSIPSGGIVAGDIDVTGSSTISNAALNQGNVTLESGVTLTLDDSTVTGTSFDDTASGATIQVDGGETLTLSGVTINGGIINNFTGAPSGGIIAGDIDVIGSSTISNATLNHGNVTIESNVSLTLDGVTVNGTSFDDTASGATIQIDGGETLKLSGTTINGGAINDYNSSGVGTIDVAGDSTIGNAALNQGNVKLESNVTLTLDGTTVTGTSFDDTASGATIQIDSGVINTATLSGVTIDGGTINDFSSGASGSIVAGDIDVTGSSTISNATLNHGNVTIESNVSLTLDGTTVTGTSFDDTASGAAIQIDGNTTLTLNGATINGGTINDFTSVPSGGIIAGDIDVTGDSTISHAALNQGNVKVEAGVHLTLDGSTVTGTSFDDTASGAVIQIDGTAGDTLTLNGVTIGGGGITVAAGGLVQTSGTVTLTDTSVTNDGTIEITGGTLKITGSGSVADSTSVHGGTIQIDGGAVLELNAGDSQNVSFNGTGGELQVDTDSFGGNIVGLAATDEIDLRTIGYGAGITTTGTYVSNADHTGGTLTITDGADSISMQLVGDYRDGHFAGASDGHGGTLITLNAIDDIPAFTPGETAQSATVIELANSTGSTTTDDSLPAGGTFTFTDIDLTDRPTATVTLQNVTWTGGTLTDAETHALQDAFVLTPVSNTNNGEIDWTYAITDSSLDFLGAGQTATVTSTVTLNDNQGGTDTASVTITIDGANDVPVITATGGGLTELANVTGSIATDTATGTITFSDADTTDRPTVTESFTSFSYVDAQGHDISLTLTSAQQAAVAALETGLALLPDSGNTNIGTVGWTYSATDSALDFMAAGDKLTMNYTVEVDDGHAGGTSTTPVYLTITGSDDAPTVSFAPATAVSTDENHAVTIGGITVSDVDAGNSQIEVTLAAGRGSLSLANTDDLTVTDNGSASVQLFGSQAAIDAALSHGVVYTPGTDFSGADALTVTANDQVGAGLGGPLTGAGQIALNVEPGTPVFDSMTLTIAQGGTEVLSDANFSVTDPDTSHFLYTVNNVAGGQFDVFNGTNWLSAPTGGFTTAQIEAGHVEFVQDGTAAVPNFSIFASDGTNASAAIAPTVSFAAASPAYLDFDGHSAAVGTVATDHVGNVDAVTLQGWVDWNGQGGVGSSQLLFYNGSTADAGFGLNGVVTAAGFDLQIQHGGIGGTDTHITLAAGQWYDLAITHSNGTFTVYVDGAAEFTDTETVNGIPGSFTDNTLIGGNASGGVTEGFYGSISDVAVWNTALTQSQIVANEFTPPHGNESGLAAYFPLDDGSGATAHDATGSAGNLSITGDTPVWHTNSIADNGSLEISDPLTSEHIVVFQGSTGSLTLDHPSSFSGVISGFTGDGSLAGSDQIDLKGIDQNSSSFAENFDAANGTLFVTDGTNSATLHFNGTYQAQNFSFVSDHNGGTIVYDPPVAANAAPNAGANAPAVTTNGHGFVFNFADNGHGVTGTDHPAGDTHLFDNHMVTGAEAALNKLHDDSHATPLVPTDSHDALATAGAKAQWHASDFHFV